MSYNVFTHMLVLSSSVANALRVQAAETAHFCEMLDKFFDCLNVSNFEAGKHSHNVFKSPYRSSHDFRLRVQHIVITKQINKGYAFLFDLQWLTEEFLPYLDLWEKTVSEREGFSNAEKNMMRFSVNSFVELVQYIFSLPDVSLFPEQSAQDPLETFFGQQRQKGRVNENPNVVDFLTRRLY